MLRYYSPGNVDRWTPNDVCRTPEEFFQRFLNQMQFGDFEIDIQPGDATAYKFHVYYTPADRRLIFIRDDRSFPIHSNTNPWTKDESLIWTWCLLCDIYARVFGLEARYYDWTRACPMKDGEPVR